MLLGPPCRVRHLIGRRRLLHSLSLQLGDLGLQQVDHLLVVHLHPPRLLLSRLGQLDPGPQSPTLLRSQFYVLPKEEEEEEEERMKEEDRGGDASSQITQQSLCGAFRARSELLNPRESFKVQESWF